MYKLALKLDAMIRKMHNAARLLVVVWEEAAPDNWAQSLQSFDSGWSYSDWKVSIQMVTASKNLYVILSTNMTTAPSGRGRR